MTVSVSKMGGELDVRDFGAVGDGITDDTLSIQRAIDHACLGGGGVIYVPQGRWKISPLNAGGWSLGLTVWSDNVTIAGAGSGRSILVVDGGLGLPASRVIYVSGTLKPLYPGTTSQGWWTNQLLNWSTRLPVSDMLPAQIGETSVTLSSPADAALFAAGDRVLIRTGQTVISANDDQPDSELNEVVAVVGSTLEMARPLTKPYQQEFYLSGTSGMTSTTGSGSPAPFGVANITGNSLVNCEIRDLGFDAPEIQHAIGWNGVIGMRMSGLHAVVGGGLSTGRDTSTLICSDSSSHSVGSDPNTAWAFGPSTGCTDITYTNCQHWASGDSAAVLHCNEGVANMLVRGCTFQSGHAPGGYTGPIVSLQGRNYGTILDSNFIVGRGSATPTIVIDSLSVDGGIVSNNIVRYPPGATGPALKTDGQNWVVSGNMLDDFINDTGSGNLFANNLDRATGLVTP